LRYIRDRNQEVNVTVSIVEQARSQGDAFLSEAESKQLLAQYGVPAAKELVTMSVDEAAAFASEIGYPLVLKGCGRKILHKTEMNLVELNVSDEADLRKRFAALLDRLPEGAQGVLVAPVIDAKREFIAGLSIDPQFGPVVMFGLGGIFTEALKDVVFRVAPIETVDAMEMLESIRAKDLLGAIRGLPEVDRDALAALLVAIGKIGTEIEGVTEIDVNPILFDGKTPVAADALVRIG
jgi:acetate---CoA ligase (ADP-forming) subunit beta